MSAYTPPEFASKLSRIQRQQAISQALLQNSLTPKGTEVISGRAVRQSPLEHIARLLTGGISAYNLRKGDEEAGDIQGQIAQARQQQVDALLANPASADQGMGNPDPMIRDIAKEFAGRRAKRLEGFAGVLKDSNPEAAARAFQTGEIPTEQYQAPDMPKPEFGTDPQGNNYVLTRNRKGEVEVKFAPKPMTITNNAPAQRGVAYDSIKPQVAERQTEANVARDAISANRTALEALNEGAKSGSAGKFFQSVRKVAGAFGVDPEGKVPTEKLAMALGENILANARKLAPVTENDLKLLEDIKGSLNTEPQNLVRMLEIMNAVGVKNLQDFGGYIDDVTSGMEPEFQGILRGQKRGYEVPNLPGNQVQQFRTLQEMQARGADVSQFRDPSGMQIPPDARFDIRGTGLPPQPGGAPAPISPASGLSPQEAEELRILRERFKVR
jgi:hypothetical protein